MLGPLRLFDNVGGGVLGAVTGLALCWAVGAVLLYLPRQTELRHYAQDSAILSTLNQELPPHRLIDTLAQIDPFATLAGPAAGVDAPDPAVLDSAGVNSCRAQRRARRRQRLRARHRGLGLGRRRPVSSSRTRTSSPESTRHTSTATTASSSTRSVVSFDKVNDIAVLRVAGLTAPPLPLADAVAGTPAGLLGYPGNGPYTETAVRVGRIVQIVGRDAYGNFPIEPAGDDDPRRHPQRQLGRAGRRRAGSRDHDRLRPAGGTDGGYGVPTERRPRSDREGRRPSRSRHPASTADGRRQSNRSSAASGCLNGGIT